MKLWRIKRRKHVARCAFCFRTILALKKHVVVLSQEEPPAELHFHIHPCWDQFRRTSPAGFGEAWKRQLKQERDWTPERIEHLRGAMGKTHRDFRALLRISSGRLAQIMDGMEGALTLGLLVNLSRLAVMYQIDQPRDCRIDWTAPQSVFSLRMKSKMTKAAFCADVGIAKPTISNWEKYGVPTSSFRAWNKLTRYAKRVKFTVRDVVPDRDWTRERLIEAFEASKTTLAEWAKLSTCSYQMLFYLHTGQRMASRDLCHRLTKTAMRFRLKLPPEKLFHDPRSQRGGNFEPWSIETVMRLGTVPDRILAKELDRSSASVREMRQNLGIPICAAATWNGRPRRPRYSQDEVERKWTAFRAAEMEATLARKRYLNEMLPPLPSSDEQAAS